MGGAAIALLVFITSCVTCQGIKLFTKFVDPKTSYNLYKRPKRRRATKHNLVRMLLVVHVTPTVGKITRITMGTGPGSA